MQNQQLVQEVPQRQIQTSSYNAWVLVWAIWLFCVVTAFMLAKAAEQHKRSATGSEERGSFVLNREGDIVEWGSDAQALLGWAPSEIVHRNFFNLMPVERTCRHDFNAAVEHGIKHFKERTCSIRGKGGKYEQVTYRLAELEKGVRYLGVMTAE